MQCRILMSMVTAAVMQCRILMSMVTKGFWSWMMYYNAQCAPYTSPRSHVEVMQ